MCQLLGMSSHQPAAITFSFTGFSARGGLTDHHQDGWGIAFFEESGCRVLLDEKPSISSPIAEMVKNHAIKSRFVISHIRKATHGKVALNNCHPFVRELWGQSWAFAHNGDLKNFAPSLNNSYLPMGETDSELAFCFILQSLKQRFPHRAPSAAQLNEEVAELSLKISSHGIFNFLMSNGQVMLAHSSTELHYVQRQHPFTRATLVDLNMEIDFQEHNAIDDRILVVATRALTSNETWIRINPGELVVFADGRLVQSQPCAQNVQSDQPAPRTGTGPWNFAISV